MQKSPAGSLREPQGAVVYRVEPAEISTENLRKGSKLKDTLKYIDLSDCNNYISGNTEELAWALQMRLAYRAPKAHKQI